MNKTDKVVEVFPFSMLEYPFIRDDMTVEEYEIEIDYWGNHLEDVHAGNYKPLWKQREEGLIDW